MFTPLFVFISNLNPSDNNTWFFGFLIIIASDFLIHQILFALFQVFLIRLNMHKKRFHRIFILKVIEKALTLILTFLFPFSFSVYYSIRLNNQFLISKGHLMHIIHMLIKTQFTTVYLFLCKINLPRTHSKDEEDDWMIM